MDELQTALRHGCPECGGLVGVLNTRVEEAHRVRWYGCRECGWRPAENKQILPIDHAPGRRRLSRRTDLRRRDG